MCLALWIIKTIMENDILQKPLFIIIQYSTAQINLLTLLYLLNKNQYLLVCVVTNCTCPYWMLWRLNKLNKLHCHCHINRASSSSKGVGPLPWCLVWWPGVAPSWWRCLPGWWSCRGQTSCGRESSGRTWPARSSAPLKGCVHMPPTQPLCSLFCGSCKGTESFRHSHWPILHQLSF